MYSEVVIISSIESINSLFEDYKAKCPVCERPFKIKTQKPFIYCSECKFQENIYFKYVLTIISMTVFWYYLKIL